MRGLPILLVSLVTTTLCAGGSLTLEDISPHFATNTDIIWKAPTNELRGQFWVYRKLPETFSEAVISNAIVLGSLQEKGFPKPSTNRLFWDFDPYPSGHPCTFLIDPENGVLSYAFPGFRNGSPEELPTDQVVVKRAFESAMLLGIEPTQLAQKGITTNFCEYDMKGRLTTNNACGRGIILPRRIDGVDFHGEDEGFSIEFGSRGRIRFFSLTWPKLQQDKKHQTATPLEIIVCIRNFKTLLAPEGNENYLAQVKELSKARKLTITRITPYYGEGVYGEMPKENGPTEQSQFVTPFAELQAVAEFQNTKLNVILYSPILTTEVNRLLKAK